MTLVGSRPEWVLAMLACWRMGAVALPCNPQLRRKDLELRARAADPKLCVGEARYLAELPDGIPYMDMDDLARVFDEDLDQETPAAMADLAPTDPAAIVFTSGTTGEPRGVVYPQRYLAGQELQAKHWFGARDGEIAWCTAAPGWSKSTRNAFIAPWLRAPSPSSTTAASTRPSGCASARSSASTSSARRRPSTGCWPSAASCAPVPGLRRMVSAGEPIEPDVIRLFRERLGLGDRRRLRPDRDRRGQRRPPRTRTTPSRDGSMGRPLPGNRDADRRRASCSCAPPPPPPSSTATSTARRFEGEWWPTGDRVREDEAGYLWFEGRDDDLILSSGYRIGPFEVESALVSHPAVAEAAAVAAPDPERGSVVRAIVVLHDGSAPSERLAAELQEHVKAQTAPYKYPRIVEFAEELPKTNSGKIRRAELRAPSG